MKSTAVRIAIRIARWRNILQKVQLKCATRETTVFNFTEDSLAYYLDSPRHLTSCTMLEQSLQNTGTYSRLEITITTQLQNKSSQEEALQFQMDGSSLNHSLIDRVEGTIITDIF